MAKKTLEQMVEEMTAEEAKLNLRYLARGMDEGDPPTYFEWAVLIDRSWACFHDPLPPRS